MSRLLQVEGTAWRKVVAEGTQHAGDDVARRVWAIEHLARRGKGRPCVVF